MNLMCLLENAFVNWSYASSSLFLSKIVACGVYNKRRTITFWRFAFLFGSYAIFASSRFYSASSSGSSMRNREKFLASAIVSPSLFTKIGVNSHIFKLRKELLSSYSSLALNRSISTCSIFERFIYNNVFNRLKARLTPSLSLLR